MCAIVQDLVPQSDIQELLKESITNSGDCEYTAFIFSASGNLLAVPASVSASVATSGNSHGVVSVAFGSHLYRLASVTFLLVEALAS